MEESYIKDAIILNPEGEKKVFLFKSYLYTWHFLKLQHLWFYSFENQALLTLYNCSVERGGEEETKIFTFL